MKRKSLIMKLLFLLLICFISIAPMSMAIGAEMNTYTSYPLFLSSTVKPNVMIILDTSTSMLEFAYHQTSGKWSTDISDPIGTYDGYFDSDKNYSYDATNDYFYVDASGGWSGNLLNFITMRRMDIAKKVLTGGRTTTAADGSTVLQAQPFPNNTGWSGGYDRYKKFKLSGTITYAYHYRTVDAKGGYFRLCNSSVSTYGTYYYTRVKVTSTPQGIVQQNALFVNLGLAIYGPDSLGGAVSGADQGGKVLDPIGDTIASASIVSHINAQDMLSTNPVGRDTWTQMAETLYTVMGYFGQETATNINTGPRYHADDYTVSDAWDPFFSATGDVACVKSFVILISDGEANYDTSLPASLKTSYGVTSGQPYLDDVAYWAHTSDIRSSSFGKDTFGMQTVTTYTISTFGGGTTLLKSTAKYGGFIDSNGNNLPDLASEYDEDGDGDPDNYFAASSATELTNALTRALVDIQDKAATSTAISVLATSGEGEGNMVQAYFKPKALAGASEIRWPGYLHALWVDPRGNLREDTDNNHVLAPETDKIVEYFVDSGSGDTKIKRFAVSAGTPYPDTSTASYEVKEINEITPLWDAGTRLSTRNADDRKIFTFVDVDGNNTVDDPGDDPYDTSGEVVGFDTVNDGLIEPYLGLGSGSITDASYLGTAGVRAENLIDYIRGKDSSDLSGAPNVRNRTVSGAVWKLGDIVNSTPVSVSKPVDNFHVIYSDESYQTYYTANKNRETVVYVGGNDGMLHAFTSWQYNSQNKSYTNPGGTETIGDEIWAYIPQSLLPHLKWLASPDYTHVYYVDLKPKIFDAKIRGASDDWGTFLLIGLNLGGKEISATEDFDGDSINEPRTFSPSYSCLDITDPRNPRLLWEKSYDGLQMSTSIPTIVRVGDSWYAVFGSGPSGYTGESSQTGKVFVVNLKTGAPYQSGGNDWLFATTEANAFMNSPVSLDIGLNYNVDAIYFGDTYFDGSWEGNVHKITIPRADSIGDYDDNVNNPDYSDDPFDADNPWQFSMLFDGDGPITAPLALSTDIDENIWIYGGTGRYLKEDDKINTDTQYFFGIKDPFFNPAYSATYYHIYTSTKGLTSADLLDADGIIVTDTNQVFVSGSLLGTFADLLNVVDGEDGWIRSMTGGERVLSKPVMLGGVDFVPSFVPNSDICGFGGDSYLYGVYYETGTAFYKAVFNDHQTVIETIGGSDYNKVLDKIALGAGKSSRLGVHVGEEDGASGFVQQSSGNVVSVSLNPALNVKSGLRSWRER